MQSDPAPSSKQEINRLEWLLKEVCIAADKEQKELERVKTDLRQAGEIIEELKADNARLKAECDEHSINWAEKCEKLRSALEKISLKCTDYTTKYMAQAALNEIEESK